MFREKLVEVTINEVKKRMKQGIGSEKSKHADTIIKNHVAFSTGAGLIPVPVIDIVAVSAVQLDMIRQVAKVYEVDFSETQGKAIVSALTSSTLARAGASSIAKAVPFIGTYIGGASNAVLAGASTFALGEVFKRHFETGGTILDFDTERLKRLYQEKFEKGKSIAQEASEQPTPTTTGGFTLATEDQEATTSTSVDTTPPSIAATSSSSAIVQDLKELAELKAAGILSDEEFDFMKQKILGQL
ncbi:MAG: DUF697 domain-containing protein [Bacteroidota bacterium]